MRLLLKIILAIFITYSIGLSFKRYYYFSLDGDLPGIVLTVNSYKAVTQDPFGLNVIVHDSIYPATNRYFAHLSISAYFKSVPFWLQNFYKPIDSVYIACALAKTLIQLFLIYLIALFVTNKRKFWDLDVLLVASIIIPLFQTYGYYSWMAIIDNSVTYTFFYALSISLVLLFFLPFFNSALGRTSFNFSWLKTAILLILIIIISFDGPLNSPVILLICVSIILNYFVKNYRQLYTFPIFHRITGSIKRIPGSLISLSGIAIVVGLYSFYVGRNNSENFWEAIPISERYSRLPTGFLNEYTLKLGPPLLIIAVVVNFWIISRLKPNEEARKIISLLKWFGVLSIIYMLLLPLGGYRSYRYNIIRFDTILPITLGLVFFYGYSTFYILKHLQKNYKMSIYVTILVIISCVYLNANEWGHIHKNNQCERDAIEKIAASEERVVFIDRDCSVVNWVKTTDVNDSKNKSALLLYWNILKEQKTYYQK